MTVGPDLELVGLPVGGPTSPELVMAQLALDPEQLEEGEADAIALVVAATNGFVRLLPTAHRSVNREQWMDQTRLGATMLASRLHRRRNSPDGVAAFGDAGAVYVQRNDPDVGMLLELGRSTRPAVG